MKKLVLQRIYALYMWNFRHPTTEYPVAVSCRIRTQKKMKLVLRQLKLTGTISNLFKKVGPHTCCLDWLEKT